MMTMMLLTEHVWMLWAVGYFSVERERVPCMRKHVIEVDHLYQCCVPLIERGVHRLLKHWK